LLGFIIVLFIIIGVIYYFVGANTPSSSGKPTQSWQSKAGKEGELKAINTISQVIERTHIHNSVYITKSKLSWAECDIIAVGKGSVYVIEVKNYTGTITGSPTQQEWMQRKVDTAPRSFYNPLLQNQTHIEALKRQFPNILVRGIVLFAGSADISAVRSSISSGACVTDLGGLVMALRGIEARNTALNVSQRKQLSDLLGQWTRVSDAVKQKHISNAQFAASQNGRR
jgi:Holliday junction resolvase-like predicted endonuclease